MKLIADETGIRISRLFSTKTIRYSEISSIVTNYKTTTIRLKSGESVEYTKYLVFWEDCPILYDMIEQYNIAFRNEHEYKLAGSTCSIDTVRETWHSYESRLSRLACDTIVEKLGPGYSVELRFEETIGNAIVYLILLKDGFVEDLPDSDKSAVSPQVPESFDNFFVADLCIWDPATGSGLYAIEPDFVSADEAALTIVSSIEDLCESIGAVE